MKYSIIEAILVKNVLKVRINDHEKPNISDYSNTDGDIVDYESYENAIYNWQQHTKIVEFSQGRTQNIKKYLLKNPSKWCPDKNTTCASILINKGIDVSECVTIVDGKAFFKEPVTKTDNWIKTEDSIPDEKQYVLCFAKGNRQFTAIYKAREFQAYSIFTEGLEIADHVTHWQPLPNPPTSYFFTMNDKYELIQSRKYSDYESLISVLEEDFGNMFHLTVSQWCANTGWSKAELETDEYWQIWLLKHDGKIIGICGLYTIHPHDTKNLWLGWLGILPEYRNKNITKQYIMPHLYDTARSINCKFIMSYVDSEGRPLNFYYREGFKVISTVKDYCIINNMDYIDGSDFESPEDLVICKNLYPQL